MNSFAHENSVPLAVLINRQNDEVCTERLAIADFIA